MSRNAPIVAIVVISVLFCLGCEQTPRIDGSSTAACKASMERVTSGLTKEENEELTKAVVTIMLNGRSIFEMKPEEIESDENKQRLLRTIDGKTAAEIIAIANNLKNQNAK